MPVSYDHTQYAVDMRMMLGEGSSEMQHKAPFTDKEFYRSRIDSGFNGSVACIAADLYFEGGASVIQNVTWKWQVMSKGQSAWTDLHSAVAEQWSGATDTGIRVVMESPSLGLNNTVPMDIRLIASAQTAATISVRIGGANKTPAVRVIGESL